MAAELFKQTQTKKPKMKKNFERNENEVNSLFSTPRMVRILTALTLSLSVRQFLFVPFNAVV